MKPTAERAMDVAEELFAERGYQGTTLGDVADGIGIRSPSLYNHFRNKEALYHAVLNRLIEQFNAPLRELREGPLTRERIRDWQARVVRMHVRNPHLARIIQHEALSGGPGRATIVERLIEPMVADTVSALERIANVEDDVRRLLLWTVMGFNNIVMSYVTMAPIYRSVLDIDPLGEQATERQVEIILRITDAFWSRDLGTRRGRGRQAAGTARSGRER